MVKDNLKNKKKVEKAAERLAQIFILQIESNKRVKNNGLGFKKSQPSVFNTSREEHTHSAC